MSSLPHLVRQSLRAACIVLLLASNLAASSIAADCASQCAHTCCRVSPGGAGAHCSMPGHQAQRACGLKARCTHSQQSAITALPLLAAAERPLLRRPDAAILVALPVAASPTGLAHSIDSPPPRVLA